MLIFFQVQEGNKDFDLTFFNKINGSLFCRNIYSDKAIKIVGNTLNIFLKLIVQLLKAKDLNWS